MAGAEVGFHAEVWVKACEAFPHIHERLRDVLRTRVSLWLKLKPPALIRVFTCMIALLLACVLHRDGAGCVIPALFT